MKSIYLFFFFTLITVLFSSASHADWINLSGAENARNIAELYVEKDHVKIRLEVFVGDLPLFEELIPDSLFSKPIPGRPGPAERIKNSADQTFQVITDSGEKAASPV